MLLGLLGACASPSPPSPPISEAPKIGGDDAHALVGARRPLPTSTLAAQGETLVVTKQATSLGLAAFSPNGRIQPRGLPTSYYFEYGETNAYGRTTSNAQLPPRLAAYYHEGWDSRAGWQGGMAGQGLVHIPTGGVSGGFVRYATPGDIDVNHADGIGPNELVQYMYPSVFEGSDYAAWSGGQADLRGARISTYVRGNAFVPHGSELVFWLQSTPNEATKYDSACPDFPVLPCTETARWSNWAFTGFNLTDSLMSGAWQKVAYQLVNDTTQWTYAGHYIPANRADYVYAPLDSVLSRLNGDIFHMLVFFEVASDPEGSIDFDDFEVAYRNRSVLLESNGGHLASAPPSADDPAHLTDGWRNGANRMWSSAASARGPLEIIYDLEHPVLIDAVQIHQNPDWPSKDVEVLISSDGVTYTSLFDGVIPATANAGPNFAFLLQTGIGKQASHVKVRILSGYQPERWGLGEIEVFGSGAVMQTDDDWYDVTTDIAGLNAGTTYHYRVVAKNDAGFAYGDDMTFTVPATSKPEVFTGTASRVRGTTAKVEGRVNPLGVTSTYYFEYGVDLTYGSATADESGNVRQGGLELTPRTVTGAMAGLHPGSTYHYRLVAESAAGMSYGADATFVAK